MSINRGERRSRPPNLVEWIDESPAKIMRNAWLRTRKAVSEDHHRLRRIWRIRNEWLSKGEKCRGKIPPGAFRRQKSGKPIPPWLIEPGHMSQYPVAEVNTCYIYAIVDLKTGKTYVGRTIKNPYVRFVEHRKSGDPLGKAILMDDSKFVVLTLEVLPRHFPCALQSSGIQQHWRVRENSWIHRLNTFQNGCNTCREIAKPRYPPLPSHGFGIRPVKRSRHGTRVTNVNGG